MVKIFDENDYIPLTDDDDITDKYVILDNSHLKPECRSAKYQLFLAKSGFGCEPHKHGTKIFGAFIDSDGVIRRETVLGIAKEEAIKEWEKEYKVKRDILLKNYETNQ